MFLRSGGWTGQFFHIRGESVNPLFEQFTDPQTTPFRRRAFVKVTFDDEGKPTIESIEREIAALSRTGSLDSIKVLVDTFYSCGHSANVAQGGKCQEPRCNRISCICCFGQCHVCSKPICLEHSKFFCGQGTQRIRICRSCHGNLRRKRILVGFVKALLNPFIKF